MHPNNAEMLKKLFGPGDSDVPQEVAVTVDRAAVVYEMMGGGALPAATVAALVAPFMRNAAVDSFKVAPAEEAPKPNQPDDWSKVAAGTKVITTFKGKEREGKLVDSLDDGGNLLRIKVKGIRAAQEIPAVFVRLDV
jgi:hypothetical protein